MVSSLHRGILILKQASSGFVSVSMFVAGILFLQQQWGGGGVVRQERVSLALPSVALKSSAGFLTLSLLSPCRSSASGDFQSVWFAGGSE